MAKIGIGGTEYPIKYGRAALQEVLKLAGAKSLAEAEKIDKIPLDKWGYFVLAGCKTGAKIEQSEPPTIEQIDDALDVDVSIYMQAQRIFLADVAPADQIDPEGN